MQTILPLTERRRVYCAGPLFNAAERREMEEISAVLADGGFETFVPHADGMEFAEVHPYLAAQGHDAAAVGRILHEAIFALDTYQVVVGCGSLVFNANGRVPDEGGVAELTMAWMLGKPVLVFKEDARSMIAGRDNPLVVGQTRFHTIGEIEGLAEALRATIEEHDVGSDWEVPCPPHLRDVLDAGERLWQCLGRFGAARPVEELAELVLSLFGPERKVTAL